MIRFSGFFLLYRNKEKIIIIFDKFKFCNNLLTSNIESGTINFTLKCLIIFSWQIYQNIEI